MGFRGGGWRPEREGSTNHDASRSREHYQAYPPILVTALSSVLRPDGSSPASAQPPALLPFLAVTPRTKLDRYSNTRVARAGATPAREDRRK